jgi:hypothetical protein
MPPRKTDKERRIEGILSDCCYTVVIKLIRLSGFDMIETGIYVCKICKSAGTVHKIKEQAARSTHLASKEHKSAVARVSELRTAAAARNVQHTQLEQEWQPAVMPNLCPDISREPSDYSTASVHLDDSFLDSNHMIGLGTASGLSASEKIENELASSLWLSIAARLARTMDENQLPNVSDNTAMDDESAFVARLMQQMQMEDDD